MPSTRIGFRRRSRRHRLRQENGFDQFTYRPPLPSLIAKHRVVSHLSRAPQPRQFMELIHPFLPLRSSNKVCLLGSHAIHPYTTPEARAILATTALQEACHPPPKGLRL